ncbi:hypothetical protein Nepgr_008256 [Nepenthes gracilis]|uniref:Uncharacterized protein n=1 Tax=Nepenthes gracilis TaxID=150966 RepID=A0AAD3S8Q6_NEPGR|nr:hypothetical protein Nepgr_008256 [Nepenthes gracilis]
MKKPLKDHVFKFSVALQEPTRNDHLMEVLYDVEIVPENDAFMDVSLLNCLGLVFKNKCLKYVLLSEAFVKILFGGGEKFLNFELQRNLLYRRRVKTRIRLTRPHHQYSRSSNSAWNSLEGVVSLLKVRLTKLKCEVFF